MTWIDFMKASRGKWTRDPIHNGSEGRDLLLFRPHPQDASKGVFIQVRGPRVSAGTFSEAFPHIGEAAFFPKWTKDCTSSEEALVLVRTRTGVPS